VNAHIFPIIMLISLNNLPLINNILIHFWENHPTEEQCDQAIYEKSAQLCPNSAQNGALLNKNLRTKKLLVKICVFIDNKQPKIFGKKLRPKGVISPNLVTLPRSN
jgi:hypothetical protein